MQPHQAPRIKIRSQQDWIKYTSDNPQATGADLHVLRTNCYRDIEALRQRPLLVYAVNMAATRGAPTLIEPSDVDGFTDMINSLKGHKAVDVLIHSPGGMPDATERIVSILRGAFEEVHFLIPHSAYSAATMLALSGNSITMHTSATLGPIDPQLGGTPARAIKKGFERVRDLLKEEGASSLPAYLPLLEKYSLELLEVCSDSEFLSRKLVKEWIVTYMLKGKEVDEVQVDKVVEFFADYENHLTHSRPLMYHKLSEFGLPVHTADEYLCELLWEAYILLNNFFSATPIVKIFETTRGISWGRQSQQIQFQMPVQVVPPQVIS